MSTSESKDTKDSGFVMPKIEKYSVVDTIKNYGKKNVLKSVYQVGFRRATKVELKVVDTSKREKRTTNSAESGDVKKTPAPKRTGKVIG
jgi:hypothetical protein